MNAVVPNGPAVSHWEDRSEIEGLIVDFVYAIDMGDYDRAAALFSRTNWKMSAPEGPILAEATGADEVRALLVQGMDHGGSPRTFHVASNMRIIVDESGATATGRTYCTQFQAAAELPLQPIGCAIWRDRFEKDEEGWHFIERWTEGRIVGDFRARLRSDATIVTPKPTGSVQQHAP
jgi:hypothetical protein